MKKGQEITIWFMGLSGSGKSTLSSRLSEALRNRGRPVVLLDGDSLRNSLSRDLGFSPDDRTENLRRAAELSKIVAGNGCIVVAAFITPDENMRTLVRSIIGQDRLIEIYLECPVEICRMRDPRGLYESALKGDIKDFTGVSAPFEKPVNPTLTIRTSDRSAEESLEEILEYLDGIYPDPRKKRKAGHGTNISRKKVAVIGLDCAPASLIFEDHGFKLPNIRALMDHGVWGPLRSTDPPITVPAWATITTGKDPGQLGVYGFRNRVAYDYSEMATANSSNIKARRVWDLLEDHGASSILVGIPQTYPVTAHNGITVAGIPVPPKPFRLTHPPELQDQLDRLADGPYIVDVADFRNIDKDRLLQSLYEMVDRRFRLASRLILQNAWNFFMLVEIATDRLHHGFWRYCVPDHPLHEPGNPYENVIKLFYEYVDQRVGALMNLFTDDTTVMIVSDHGAKSLLGGVAINEWLQRLGLLCLKEKPQGVRPLSYDMVDWTRTKAWSEGGYYARVFLNVRGREPHGIIEKSDYENFREELAGNLEIMEGPDGWELRNQVMKPDSIYADIRNVPPDLMVYFDGLSRRSIGSVGHGEIFVSGNDRGLDDANHDMYGIFAACKMSDLRNGRRNGRKLEEISCLDITPTILGEFGFTAPRDLSGRAARISHYFHSSNEENLETSGEDDSCCESRVYEDQAGFSPEEEEIIKQRLEDLGYI
jgi:adenylyl-sulfate kinase